MSDENNIQIIIDDDDNNYELDSNDSFDFGQMIKDLEGQRNDFADIDFTKMINYNLNYTVKQLLLICEYYGISKELKANKCNKEEIINYLVMFESNPKYEEIVNKRETMWFYISELKNDRFMKRYIIW